LASTNNWLRVFGKIIFSGHIYHLDYNI
jgi:hypothetical protein